MLSPRPMPANSPLTRRDFLRRAGLAGAALGFPAIIPASALGLDGAVAPSNRVALGAVGFNMGLTNLRNLAGVRGVEVVAVCDVDSANLRKGQAEAPRARAFRDWREMIGSAKLDAVTAAVPDHAHAALAIWAMDKGVDVFGEKPLAHHQAEGKAIVEAVHRNARVWQTGTWQRSVPNFRRAVEIVRNGHLGKIHRVEIGLPHGLDKSATYQAKGRGAPGAPPPSLDYDLWVGPAPFRPYHPRESHYFWRYSLHWGTGQVGNWFTHHGDIALWAMDLDHPSRGPSAIRSTSTYRKDPDGAWDVPADFTFECDLPGGAQLFASTEAKRGTTWHGEKGWLRVDRGLTEASDPALLRRPREEDEWAAAGSTEHWAEFIDGVRTRRRTVAHAEAAHAAFTVGALALISMRLGNRPLRWDPAAERVIGDPEADALRERPWRPGWKS